MKILLVSFYFTPETGAAPSRMTNMANGFKEYGIDVDILTTLPNYPKGEIYEGYKGKLYVKETINSCNAYRYWTYATVSKNPILRMWGMMSFALSIWVFGLRRNLIREYDAVIVQSPPLFVSFSAIMLFKRIYKKKMVLNVSDLWPLSAIEIGAMRDGSLTHKLFLKIENFIYKYADAVLGQSKQILSHIYNMYPSRRCRLYRNLQRNEMVSHRERGEKIRLVYAGLLGVAQNLYELVTNIDFQGIDVEFHIYGSGNQTDEIKNYAALNSHVFYHGIVDKKDIPRILVQYDASIIPLKNEIKGAVPSKIYDVLPLGVPIIFSAGGEGEEFIKEYKVGYTSTPGKYDELEVNIKKLKSLTLEEYRELSQRCLEVSKTELDFDVQIEECVKFISEII